jgi:predicted acetyltransferase
LYTPHPSLYRRYGWQIAADERIFRFNPKDLQLAAQPARRGRLSYVTADEWQALDVVHRAHRAGRNGALERDELWWRNWVLRSWFGNPEAILWESDAGDPEGYLLYIEPGWTSRDSGSFIVTELTTVSPDAYLNLLAVLAQQDIRERVEYYAPSEDPLPLLFVEEERLKIEQHHTVLLRVVDVQAALSRRPSSGAIESCAFSLEVTDAYAPWNAGTWRVQSAGGKTTVERADGPGDLQLDVRHLAPLINGYVTPSMAVRAGLARAANPAVLPDADRFFAVSERPYFADRF